MVDEGAEQDVAETVLAEEQCLGGRRAHSPDFPVDGQSLYGHLLRRAVEEQLNLLSDHMGVFEADDVRQGPHEKQSFLGVE